MSLSDDDFLLGQRVRFGELFDLYSSLLTGRQRAVCGLFLRDDLSLAELGCQLGMTRQGAHDLVRRSRELLDGIEGELGLHGLRRRCGELREYVRESGVSLPPELAARVENLLSDGLNGSGGEDADV
ncbi:MAG: DNA-binding protein [Synergistaceae bacterium]|nr:DNA-binding protein [Synergistaceae bacterium]